MRISALLLSFLLAFPGAALAGPGMELTYKGVPALDTLLSASIGSGDYIPVYDASATRMKKVDATTLPLGGAFNGTVGATTPSTGVFTSIGATLAVTDTRAPTADSATTNNGFNSVFTVPADTTGTNTHNAFNVTPTISNSTGGTNTFNGYNFGNVTGDAQVDVTALRIGTGTRLGTSEGIVISTGWDKGVDITNSAAADSGATEMGIDLNVTTPVDTTGTNDHWGLNIDFSIGNATAGTNSARGINIANVTGDAQVDVTGIKIGTGTTLGTSNAIDIGSGWDAGIVNASTLNQSGTIIVDTVTVNKLALSLPGRVDITICGDGTTINNNTVYYGPSMVPVANAGRTCDITQVGNVTEATADAPALDSTAIQVLSMDCLTADPGAAGVSFTLRNNAAATVPSVTCSVANTKLGCTANVQTTTAIASGNPISIAAASTGNQGATPFVCTIHAAY